MMSLALTPHTHTRTGYAVDSLLSYHEHVTHRATSGVSHGLLLSSGWTSTHVLPLVDGRALFDVAYRLDVGGAHQVQTLPSFLVSSLRFFFLRLIWVERE